MRRTVPILAGALLLAGCGSARPLRPAPGEPLPPAPYGATTVPTPADLLTPSTQARPERDDDLLKESVRRPADPYALPPPQ